MAVFLQCDDGRKMPAKNPDAASLPLCIILLDEVYCITLEGSEVLQRCEEPKQKSALHQFCPFAAA